MIESKHIFVNKYLARQCSVQSYHCYFQLLHSHHVYGCTLRQDILGHQEKIKGDGKDNSISRYKHLFNFHCVNLKLFSALKHKYCHFVFTDGCSCRINFACTFYSAFVNKFIGPRCSTMLTNDSDAGSGTGAADNTNDSLSDDETASKKRTSSSSRQHSLSPGPGARRQGEGRTR